MLFTWPVCQIQNISVHVNEVTDLHVCSNLQHYLDLSLKQHVGQSMPARDWGVKHELQHLRFRSGARTFLAHHSPSLSPQNMTYYSLTEWTVRTIKMSGNSEKRPSQIPKAQGDIFKWLESKTQSFLAESNSKVFIFEVLKTMTFWHFCLKIN